MGERPGAVRAARGAVLAGRPVPGLPRRAGLAAALWRAEDWTLPALGCAVTLASACASLAVHRDSLVAREGPAR
ncbi:hypothetical protein [Methylobacterium flocculans]|uniref:hypothetical protein n=1 Tax=Methylobacterium flocculans TaxID=2984843 RepID=UPI0021F30B05|nr:hypothetical protein [Methylobacterium sp. FF17]